MAKNFVVLKIDQLQRVGDNGRIEPYYRYRIKTAGGVVLSVDVSQADYTPERATPILAAAAANSEAMLRL